MSQSVSKQPTIAELKELRKYARSAVQLRAIDAVLSTGSNAKAAKEIGINPRTMDRTILRIKKNAAIQGYAPNQDMNKPVPDGFSVAGVSTMYDADGEVKLQWVKSKQEAEQLLELALEAVREGFNDVKLPKIAKPLKVDTKELLAVYPMGDPHIGLYTWAKETGDDFDVKIAERNLVTAVERLVECAPASDQALIVNVGDFYHSDTMDNRTSRSGNALDVDTRWANVLYVGVRAMRSCIEAALKKHNKVHVINEIGNHDDHTAQVLTLALSMSYEKNPRVTFDMGPGRFHYYRFHDVLIGVTHGDTVKPEKLGGIMATDRAKDWGETVRRYWYTGHIHTRNVFELPGCEVESFRTLAPKDAWTASMGYRSGRDMYCIVIHKEFGEIERHRKDILMLK